MIQCFSVTDYSFQPSIILSKMIHEQIYTHKSSVNKSIPEFVKELKYSFVSSLSSLRNNHDIVVVYADLTISQCVYQEMKQIFNPYYRSRVQINSEIVLRLGAEIYHWFEMNPWEARLQNLEKCKKDIILLKR